MSGENIYSQSKCKGNQIFVEKACAGDDISSSERILFDLVNKYRQANGRPEIRLSKPLSMVANRRMLDLGQNLKTLTHSWSNCPYDINVQKTWGCVLDAPKKFGSGFNGQGYETLYRTETGCGNPGIGFRCLEKKHPS